MIRPREIRNALAGALVFLAAGMLQACAADALTGLDGQETAVPVQALGAGEGTEGPPVCYWVGDVYVCR